MDAFQEHKEADERNSEIEENQDDRDRNLRRIIFTRSEFEYRSEAEAYTSEIGENSDDLGYFRHVLYSFLRDLHAQNGEDSRSDHSR